MNGLGWKMVDSNFTTAVVIKLTFKASAQQFNALSFACMTIKICFTKCGVYIPSSVIPFNASAQYKSQEGRTKYDFH